MNVNLLSLNEWIRENSNSLRRSVLKRVGLSVVYLCLLVSNHTYVEEQNKSVLELKLRETQEI